MIWIVVILVSGWAVLGCAIQRRVLWPNWAMGEPAKGLTAKQSEWLGIDVMWLNEGEEGVGQVSEGVEVWFMMGRGVSEQQPGGVVFFAHGNGETIDDWMEELSAYRDMGVSVALVEYRGYGRSKGKPTEKGIVADYCKAYDLIRMRGDVDPTKIIIHGRSVGGGIAAGLAKNRASVGLILQSTFVSVKKMARKYLLPGFMVLDPLDVKATLKTYPGEVLIIHGQKDQIIPVKNAHENYGVLQDNGGANRSQLIIFEQMTHNTQPPEKEYWQAIGNFLSRSGVIKP